jgi:hypothetical protein
MDFIITSTCRTDTYQTHTLVYIPDYQPTYDSCLSFRPVGKRCFLSRATISETNRDTATAQTGFEKQAVKVSLVPRPLLV